MIPHHQRHGLRDVDAAAVVANEKLPESGEAEAEKIYLRGDFCPDADVVSQDDGKAVWVREDAALSS
ncbi:MAG: hypothetical protein LBK71_12415 [Verrucomicrobiales bacterium]|jgi:hypothetical protein|nr:hypothetical protein [Verrucomicrobiales bacterium]